MTNLNIDTINAIINTFSTTSMFFQYFFTFMGMVIAMLPVAKYLVYVKDVRDWRLLSTITEMGLEEMDKQNTNTEIWIQNMQELTEMDETHGHDLNTIWYLEQREALLLDDKFALVIKNDRLQTDLALLQAMVEEQAAKINAQSKELAQLKRGSKKAINVMPALTINTIVRPIGRDILPAVEDEEYMH